MPMLEVRKLSVRYGPLEAVRGIDFVVDEGQIVALIGSNGAGKSTTLKALMGLVPIAGGQVLMQGHEIGAEPAASRVARGLALSPEGRRLFGRMTVLDNLLVGAHTVHRRADIEQSLARLQPQLAADVLQLALLGGIQVFLAGWDLIRPRG